MAENTELGTLDIDQIFQNAQVASEVDQSKFPTTLDTTIKPVQEDPLKKLDRIFTNAENSTPGRNTSMFNPKIVPTNAIKKYTDMPYGYTHNFDNDTFYGEREGALKTTGKFFGRLVLGAAAKTGQGVGFLIGMSNPSNWDSDFIENTSQNGLSQIFEALDEKTKNDWLPVYQEAADKEKGFWNRLFTDGDFWAEDVADALAFLTSAYVPGLALSKIGLGAKALKMASGLRLGTQTAEEVITGASKVQNYLTQSARAAKMLDRGVQWATSTAGESMFEATETKRNIINSLTQDKNGNFVINPSTGLPYTEDEKKAIAGKNALSSFALNAALLGVTNTFQLRWLGNIFNKEAEQIAFKGLKTPASLLAPIENAAEKTGRISKFLDSKIGKFFSGAPKGVFAEGFVEENFQLAIQRLNESYGQKGKVRDALNIQELFNQTGAQTVDALMGEDSLEARQTSISIGLGGLIGSFSAGLANIAEAGAEKLSRENLITTYNNSQQNWLKFGNIYKTETIESVDDKGNPIKTERIVFDKNNQPVEDEQKIAGVLSGYRFSNSALEEANGVKDPFNRNVLRDKAFANFVKAHVNAGIENTLLEKLDDVIKASPEEIAQLGFILNDDVKEQVDRYKSLAGRIIKQNKLINNSIIFDNTEDDLARKNTLIDLAADQAVFNSLADEVNASKTELKNELVDSKNTSLSDSLVDQLNELVQRIKSQQEKVDEVKKFGEESYRYKLSSEILDDLQNDLKDVLKQNELSVKELKQGKDGFYKYEKKRRNRPGIQDQYNRKSKLKSELDNIIDELGSEWSHYADAKNGKQNYLSNFDEEVVKPLQEQAEKVKQELDKVKNLPKSITATVKNENDEEESIEITEGTEYRLADKQNKNYNQRLKINKIDEANRKVNVTTPDGRTKDFDLDTLVEGLRLEKWELVKQQEIKKPTSKTGNTDEGDTEEEDLDSEVENGDVSSDDYRKKPKFSEIKFFKTVGKHYLDDKNQVLNTENGSDRFYSFTAKHNVYNRYYYLKVITGDNDDFKIRDVKFNPDDIKVVLMKRTKVGDSFRYDYVDKDNNIIPEGQATKDNIIYTSLSDIKNYDVDRVKELYTVTSEISDSQIENEIKEHLKYQKDLVKRIKNGEEVYLKALTTSPGVQTIIYGSEVDEKGRQIPVENSLEGTVIVKDPDYDDLRSANNPDVNIDLRIVTADNVPAKGLKAGRPIVQEYTLENGRKVWGDKIFRVFSRNLNDKEKETVYKSFLRLSELFNKKYGQVNYRGVRTAFKRRLTKEEDKELKLIELYLKGVINWSKPLSGKAGTNNFWVSNGLHKGSTVIPLTKSELEKSKDQLLDNVYHNINNTYLGKNDSFTTIKFVKGKAIVDNVYDTYKEYLIAKRKGGESAPIYSSLPLANSNIPQRTSAYIVWKDEFVKDEAEDIKKDAELQKAIQKALPLLDQKINDFVSLKTSKLVIKNVVFTFTKTPEGIVFKYQKGNFQRRSEPLPISEVPGKRNELISYISQVSGYKYGGLGRLQQLTIEKIKKDISEKRKEKQPQKQKTSVSQVISDEEYDNFIDTGNVSDDILNSIAEKVINRLPLSERENAIFTAKTSEINEIIKNKASATTAAEGPFFDIESAVNNAKVENGKMSAVVYEKNVATGEVRELYQGEVNIKNGNLLKAKTDLSRLLQKQIQNQSPDLDEEIPFRLVTELEVEDLDDLDFFQEFMQEKLPQIPITRMNHLILGKAYGAFMKGGIYIYNNAKRGTGFHEAFEAVWASYLTDQERLDLYNEFRSRKGSFYNPYSRQTKQYSEASLYDVREMLADEFADYIENEDFLKEPTPKTKNIFQKLWDFIKQLFGLSKKEMTDLNSKINNIFKNISKGGYKNAKPIRDVTKLAPQFKTVTGLSQQETLDALEGLNFNFFTDLFKEGNNIDSIIRGLDKDAVNNLLVSTLDGAFDKVIRSANIASSRIASTIASRKSELYDIFKANLKRYGIKFFELEDADENKIENTLGIRDSITIDPRKTTSVNVSLLLFSLPNMTIENGKPAYTFNELNQNKLVDSSRVHTLLLNELSNITYIIRENGEKYNVLDQMFDKLDAKYKIAPGVYRNGYQWINSLKIRLKYTNPKGEKIPIETLEKDDVLLRVAFIKSFTNTKFVPDKVIVEENGGIYNFNPLINVNEDRIRKNWINNIKLQLVNKKSKLFKEDKKGKFVVDKTSTEYEVLEDIKQLSNSATIETILDGLRMLGISFSASPEELENKKTTLAEQFGQIFEQMERNSVKYLDDLFSKDVVGARIDSLISIETGFEGEDNVLSYYNADGEIQYSVGIPSLFSTTLNILNKVDSLKELVQTAPWLGYIDKEGNPQLHPYQANSRLLKPGGLLFNNKGQRKRASKSQELKYFVISGTGVTNTQGKNTAKLEFPEKIAQKIHYLLTDSKTKPAVGFSVINSDKSTEFGISMPDGLFVEIKDIENLLNDEDTKITNIYIDQLKDELAAAVFQKTDPINIQYYKDGVNKLGHFRDIISNDLKSKFKEQILNEDSEDFGDYEKFVDDNLKKITKQIQTHLKEKIEDTKKFLLNNDIFYSPKGGIRLSKITDAIDNELLNTVLGIDKPFTINKRDAYSDADILNLAGYLAINEEISITEQHKLIYGHPALYKELPKRANGATSTKEAIVEDADVIRWMDQNMPRNDNKKRGKENIQTINVATFKDVNVISTLYKEIAENIYEDLIKAGISEDKASKKVGAKFDESGNLVKLIKDSEGKYTGAIKAYMELTEADAMAMGMPDLIRDLLFMSSKFGDEREAQWNYEIAYEKLVRSGIIPKRNGEKVKTTDPEYKKYGKSELADAKSIYDKGDPEYVFEVLKPQYFGYASTKGLTHTVFLKHAVQPKFYRHVEGTNFESLYLAAQKQNIDVIGFESGEKVGNVTNEDGDFTPIYNNEGIGNTILVDGKHQFPENMPLQTLYSRFYGIQVEQNNKPKKYVVRGTQVSKIIMSNFYENGVPINSEVESLIKDYNATLIKLFKLGKKELLKELGLEYNEKDDVYETKDLSRLIQILRSEAESRDLPDNVIEAIDYIENENDEQELLYQFDTIITREKIDNILNSIVDSRVISEKMHGKASVQVASTLYESNPRNFAYLKDGIYKQLTKKEIAQLTDEEKEIIRMVSSDLKFYRKNKKTGKISAMEVYVSWPYTEVSPEELGLKLVNGIYKIPEDTTNFDKKCLELLGFRIPTQAFNSIESVIIKGFTPAANGDMIVVPSEIVGKAGSDFDIDKLNLYFPNIEVAGLERFYGEKEFNDFLYNNLIKRAIPKETVQQIINTFTKEDYTQINKATFTEGGKIEKSARFSLNDIHERLNASTATLSIVKEGIQAYNKQSKNKKAIKYVSDTLETKAGLQNRLMSIMNQLVLRPENYAELISPNSVDTLKGLSKRIIRLEKIADPEKAKQDEKSLTYLRSFVGTAITRERYLTAKRMVGISALHSTFHILAQIAGLKINPLYNIGRVKYLIPKVKKGKKYVSEIEQEPIVIKLPHHPKDDNGFYKIGYKYNVDKQPITETNSESTSGFVDGAKDPFVFDLKLSMNTSSTWFYLRHMGVPEEYIASFFSQPVLVDYFKILAKNKSNFKEVNGTKLTRELMLFEAIAPYYDKIVYGSALKASIDSLEARPVNQQIDFKNRVVKVLDTIYNKYDEFSLEEMDEAISLGKEADPTLQVAILLNYLRYEAQGGLLTSFINGIGFDTAKTATTQENIIQVSKWKRIKKEGFINNPEALLNETFLGELKYQREDTFKMFRKFFISLSPQVQEAFQPLYEKLDDPDIFMIRDDAYNLITRYQNHVLSYILHTTPFKNYDGVETTLNEMYFDMFKGDNSISKRLLKLRQSDDYTISENLFIKELMPLLATDNLKVDNIGLFRNRLDTFEINSIVEALTELTEYADQIADESLKKDINDIVLFSILQSGLQQSFIDYKKILNTDLYSETLKNIFNRFESDNVKLDVDQVWRTFHQNNWKNSSIVKKAPRWLKLEDDGTILVGEFSSMADTDYFVKWVEDPSVDEKTFKELKKQGELYKAFAPVIYENTKAVSETGDNKGKIVFMPIHKLGDGYKFFEVYTSEDNKSILEENDHEKLTINRASSKKSKGGWMKISEYNKRYESQKKSAQLDEMNEKQEEEKKQEKTPKKSKDDAPKDNAPKQKRLSQLLAESQKQSDKKDKNNPFKCKGK